MRVRWQRWTGAKRWTGTDDGEGEHYRFVQSERKNKEKLSRRGHVASQTRKRNEKGGNGALVACP